MRRSICYCDPQVIRAGQVFTWKFHYTPAVTLPKGTRLKFSLETSGRDIDWEIPSVDLSEKENVIYLQLGKDVISAKAIPLPHKIAPHYEFVLPHSVKADDTITIVVGAPPSAKEEDYPTCGNEAQLTIARRRSFLLYIDTKGKGNYEDPEIFTMDIRGSALHTIKILTPSFIEKNKRFDVAVRFEDEFGNLTSYAPKDTLIELSYEHLRENLNWKLFVPETGFVILPNLYFNEAGTYKIQLKNLMTGETFISAPIKCFQENNSHLFWGLLHGESERVDSAEHIEGCLRHVRDEKSLNFFASSCFESTEETSNDTWKLISQNVQDFNEEDRFVALLGFQYVGPPEEGVRQILYAKDMQPLLRNKELKYSSLSKIYKTFSSKEILSIPTFTMGGDHVFDFKQFNPKYEHVVEIYNAWGCSETSAEEGNPFPISGPVKPSLEGSLQKALKSNCRFGFVSGGLDDRGIYESFYESEQKQYQPGLTAIICEKYNRESVFDALCRRSCYATTGARIILGFYIAGHGMGSELNTQLKPGLAFNRHLSGYVAGTTALKKVDIIRNGKVIHSLSSPNYHLDYYYDDEDPFKEIALQDEEQKLWFIYYYLRIQQEDGHMAWSSPIWIDYKE